MDCGCGTPGMGGKQVLVRGVRERIRHSGGPPAQYSYTHCQSTLLTGRPDHLGPTLHALSPEETLAR